MPIEKTCEGHAFCLLTKGLEFGSSLGQNLLLNLGESFLIVRMEAWGKELFPLFPRERRAGGAPRVYSCDCSGVPTLLLQGLTWPDGSISTRRVWSPKLGKVFHLQNVAFASELWGAGCLFQLIQIFVILSLDSFIC